MRRWFILALLLLPATAHSQTLAITAGAGSLYDSNGGTASGIQGTLYMPDQTIVGGAADINGHVVMDLSDERMWKGFDTTIGTSFLSVTAQDASVVVALDGIAMKRKSADKKTTLIFFAGATGLGFMSPFSNAVLPKNFGSGVMLKHDFHNIKLSSLAAINGNQKTIAVGADYQFRKNIKFSGTTGVLNGAKFLDASVLVQPVTHLTFNATHQSYFVPFSVEGNSVGGNFGINLFHLGATLNESTSPGKFVTGESFSTGVHVGVFQEQEAWYRSNNRTIWTHTASETWRQHWTATETLSQSQGNSLQFGGGYQGNKYAISVNQGVQFLLDGAGYQRTTSITVRIRIHDIVVNGQTSTSAYGKTLYSVSGTTYKQTGLQAAGPGGRVNYAPTGKYEIAGTCKRVDGTAVDGCAIQIGKTTVYSNSAGRFDAHVKKHQPVVIAVDVANFTANGNWKVVSSPKTAEPDQTFDIVVAQY